MILLNKIQKKHSILSQQSIFSQTFSLKIQKIMHLISWKREIIHQFDSHLSKQDRPKIHAFNKMQQ